MSDRPTPSPHASASAWAKVTVLAPYLWLIAFFLVPFLIVLKISLSQTAIAQPPYLPVLDVAAGWQGIKDFVGGLTPANYLTLAGDDLYLFSYLRSLTVATVATAILVLIGFPIAYAMARAPRRLRPLGLIDQPVTWLSTDTAVYIGLVYSYLPFMILPLYASLEKLDTTLLEAAADLGCPRWKAFWTVTVPLALPGLGAGALLCFIPIAGEFVIPDLLGGSDTTMIGQTLWTEFFANKDWPVASAVAVVLVTLLVGPIAIYQHLQSREIEGR
jgi:putrescine transport system permease protein